LSRPSPALLRSIKRRKEPAHRWSGCFVREHSAGFW
jgi:hypothetical protein